MLLELIGIFLKDKKILGWWVFLKGYFPDHICQQKIFKVILFNKKSNLQKNLKSPNVLFIF